MNRGKKYSRSLKARSFTKHFDPHTKKPTHFYECFILRFLCFKLDCNYLYALSPGIHFCLNVEIQYKTCNKKKTFWTEMLCLRYIYDRKLEFTAAMNALFYDSVLFPLFIFEQNNNSLKQKLTGNTR